MREPNRIIIGAGRSASNAITAAKSVASYRCCCSVAASRCCKRIHSSAKACGARLISVEQVEGVRDPEAKSWLADEGDLPRVFVGPVLLGPAVGALVDSACASPAPLRALNGLVAAIRSRLVDELHTRGELPRLVTLLCAADTRVSTLALELALRFGYYGRKEVLDALLAEGLIKRLLCLQRSDLGGSLTERETDAASSHPPQEKHRRP